MGETKTDAYQRRRKLLLDVARAVAPARRSADVGAFLMVVDVLPDLDQASGAQLAMANRALQVAEPLLRRAIVGEFDHQLRGTPITALVDLHAAVAKVLGERA